MKLSIVGFGLLGSSIARAQRRIDPGGAIQCVDPSERVRAVARERGLADAADASTEALWPDADIVLLAAPVRAIEEALPDIVARVGPGAVVTDVGSVKAPILAAAERAAPAFDRFVPAHPLAGGHASGPEAGAGDLLDGKRVILTPGAAARADAVARTRDFFARLGARVSVMDASAHDQLLGYTSHLPRLVAFATMLGAERLSADLGDDVRDAVAQGFRDFTRIAASDPTMWTDIFGTNAEAVRASARRLTAEIERLADAFDAPERLNPALARAKALREEMDAGRETDMAESTTTVGFLGAPGSYSHQAAEDLYRTGDLRGFKTFADIVAAVEAREVDLGVVPVENSTAGRVAEVYQLLSTMRLHIVAEHFVTIRHCLAGVPSAGDPAGLRAVRSHTQALMQCARWLAENAPGAALQERGDTAGAARSVAEAGDPGLAAVCSARAAEINGLKVLARDIHDQDGNATRFHVLARAPLAEIPLGGPALTTVIFRTPHKPGSLITALKAFERHGVDMTKLETYMITSNRNREPMFYVDLAIDRASEIGRRTLADLSEATSFLTVLGCYPASALRGSVDGYLVVE